MSGGFENIGMPEKIQVYKDFQHLRIVRKWFGFKFILLTLFVIFWCGFLISWYAMAFSFPFRDASILMFFIFPLLHVALGIGLAYYALTGYLNRTVIHVDFNSISIRHGPLPFWGEKQVSSKAILQLYCNEDDYWLSGRGYRYHTYAVHAITRNWRNIKLLTGLDTSEQALFIEQEIEKFLNIEDKPVKGEIR